MRRFPLSVTAVVFGAVLLAGCSSGKESSASDRSTTTASAGATTTAAGATSEVTSVDDTSTTAKAGSQPGLFDFNQDGTKELTCGTADFQAGLVIRTYCDDLSGYANTPDTRATLMPGSLLAQPSPEDPRDKPVTEGASVVAIHLQAADGKEVVVYMLSSDTVFTVGSDKLADPARDSLSIITSGIQQSYPGATIKVRGHTDATGSAAANQALSERRAAAVAAFFISKGFDAGKVSSVGLGQTQPSYKEDTEVGRGENRRIELVVRPV